MLLKSAFAICVLVIVPAASLLADENVHANAETFTPWSHSELSEIARGKSLSPAAMPVGKSPEDTIAYDGPNSMSFGLTTGGSFYSAVRFTPPAACTVKALTIYLAQQAWNCSLCIWDQGSATTPGARLQSWTATSTPDAWNRFDLPTPVVRPSAEEFWGGVWLSHAAGQYPVGCDAGPGVPQRSFVSTNGSSWFELRNAGVDANINDRAIVEYSGTYHDVRPLVINSPGTGVWRDTTYGVQTTVQNLGDFTETFDVECIVRDAGASAVYGDTATVSNLDPGLQTPVNFANWTPLLYDEAYTVNVVTLLGGDDDPGNDTLIQDTHSYEEGEIAYDDFRQEAWYVVNLPSGPTDAFVVRLTPYLAPPFYITKWKIYVNDVTPFDNVRLCPDLGGFPDWGNPYQLFSSPAASSPPEWISMNFDTSLTRMATSADLWLGAQFAVGDSGPGIGHDQNQPVDMRSFWTSDLMVWNLVPDGDWMMRVVHAPAGPGVEEVPTSSPPPSCGLGQNHPNPVVGKTSISYQLPARSGAILKVYDASGRMVRSLVNETREAGTHTVIWDTRDDKGVRVAAGLYFYKLSSGGFSSVRKLVVVR